MNTTPRKTFLALLGTGVASAALLSTPAFAQTGTATETADTESANADGSSDTGGSIIVTGSRIARPNLEAPSPVTVIGAEQVALTGTTTVETLLNELPQIIPGNTRVSNNSGGENFSTIDLRGLGPGRTLILLDGERLPPSTTTGVTDVSQIPTGLIQRIDVVTGGATAVYGSDAIAGVVNFILKQDYQGMELVGQTSVSEDGTGFGFNVSGLMGGNFADDRGNLTVYASYTDRDSVSQGRYGYSRVSGGLYSIFDANGDAAGPTLLINNPDNIPAGYTTLVGGGSATPPQGVINASTLAGSQFRNLSTLLPGTFAAADRDCNASTPGTAVGSAGSVSFNTANALSINTGSGGRCGVPVGNSSRFNFAPSNYLITPYDRFTVSALGHYDLDEKTTFRTFVSFTNANQQINLAPTPATGIVVQTASPLLPADLRLALANRTYFTRTGVIAGGTGTLAGLGGRFSTGTSAGACGSGGNFTCTEVTAANFNSATITGANPTATNPATENFVINRRFFETGPRDGRFKTDAKNFRGVIEHKINDDFNVSGIFSFGRIDNALRGIGNINRTAVDQGLRGCPAGALPGCVPLNIFGANTITPAMLNFVRLDTQQQESFEQVRGAVNLVGSLGNLPGGPIGIAVGAEVRKDTGETVVDDAQRTGNIYGFNAVQGIKGSISVREVYGELRLPILDFITLGAGGRYSDYSTVGGLFNYKGEVEISPIDIVKFRATYNRAARAPNVFELFQNGDQGFPSYIDPCNQTNPARSSAQCLANGVPAGALPGFAQINSQAQAFSFGNPNLSEEKAETYTAGVVFTPGQLLGGDLTMTADYYHIRLTNRVAGLGSSFFLTQCNAGDNTACARILRDPGTGQVTSINTSVTNSATPLTTAGVDVGLDWGFDLFDGRLAISDVFTYVDTYKIGGTEFADTVFSGIGGVTVKYANTFTGSFRKGPVTFQGRYIWKKGGRQNFPGAELEDLFLDSARIPDLHLVNLSLRLQATDNMEFTLIANNVLDKRPPQTATGQFEQSNTNINFYDSYALGRNYTVQARVKF